VVDVEIDQQTNRQIQQPQLRQQLFLVDRQQQFDRLQFDGHETLHEQIQVVPGLEADALVDDRRDPVDLERQTRVLQLMLHAFVVDILEDTRSNDVVDPDGTADDRTRDLIRAEGIGEHGARRAKIGPPENWPGCTDASTHKLLASLKSLASLTSATSVPSFEIRFLRQPPNKRPEETHEHLSLSPLRRLH
jgi:hypothetical protein